VTRKTSKKKKGLRATPRSSSSSPRRKRGGGFSWWRFVFAAGLFCFAAGLLVLVWFAYDLPDTRNVQPIDKRPSITVLAHDGTMISRYGGLEGDLVKVRDLPPYVAGAVMAIEDRRFYSHFGIDPLGLARAMWVNLRVGRFAQGGSTITQQLAKNLFLTPDKTIRRKVQEAMLALVIEWRHDKDEILSAYLNRVYYGSGAYGIDGAARTYFGKTAQDLTLWESALLAGLLKAPSRYAPTANPKLARDRARVVISAMADAGFIGKAERDQEIKSGKIELAGTSEAGDLNRYYADWIINQIDSFVANNDRDIVVRTTLDIGLQRLAEEKIDAHVAALKPEHKGMQAAVVTLAKDGAVLAMIGGTDYTESQFNRATQALRQPGSSFKPAVFLAALEVGFDPDHLIEDAPITTGKYRPKNYDGKYFGMVTLTDALALSMNTATIRLLEKTGVTRLIDVSRRLGFTQKVAPELAAGLGASEATLIEMTNAYAVIANGGHAIWPYAVLSVEDTAGNILYRHTQVNAARLFAPRDIKNLDSMLVQVVARGTGQAAQLTRGHVAGKTGTSQNYRDAWFIGYTDRLVTGVWMGRDDNTAMQRVSGGGYPARLWRSYMEQAIDQSIPVFSPDLQRSGPSAQGGDSFSDMLSRLFGGGETVTPSGAGGSLRERFRGDNSRPTYNR
jgi:penicillin-binding protein 1A